MARWTKNIFIPSNRQVLAAKIHGEIPSLPRTFAKTAFPATFFAILRSNKTLQNSRCYEETAALDWVLDQTLDKKILFGKSFTDFKRKQGVPERLYACHTGLIGGYVIEGHVPADLIVKLLKEKPDVLGLAVPGMPVGSPGMEGGMPEPYVVLTFDKNGQTTVYAKR